MALLDIKRIRRDGGTQMRAKGIPKEALSNYTEAYLEGKKLPPVDVVYDGRDYWLWDGFTRCAAAEAAGLGGIPVTVTHGTHRDAIRLSFSANRLHGTPSTFEDKKYAVLCALQDEEFSKLSNRDIAKMCDVGRTTVNDLRAEVEGTAKVAAAAIVTRDDASTTPGEGDEDDQKSGLVVTHRPPAPKGNVSALQAENDELKSTLADTTEMLAEVNAELLALTQALESGDAVTSLTEQLKKERAISTLLREQLNGANNEKSEVMRAMNGWKRKYEKLAQSEKVRA